MSSETDAAGGKASVLGWILGMSVVATAVGNTKFKEAQVVVYLTDNGTTEQIGAATGSAKATDIGSGGWMFAGFAHGFACQGVGKYQ